MKKLLLLSIILLPASTCFAQFQNDNVLYKTVFPQDLCSSLQQSGNYLMLDVRSPGEYADTSSSAGYNLGHFKNAININVRELGSRLSEIGAYKNKPVYVYCSHSQRSRRASKMLADSGFTNVINVNGGVTAIRQLAEGNCVNNYFESKVGYDIIAVISLCKKLAAGNKTFILDVRNDSAYRRISTDAKINSFATFSNSIHIPAAELQKRIAEIPVDKDIVVVDLFGDEGASAAAFLVSHNYKNVSALLEGMDRLYFTDSKDLTCLKNYYSSPVKYKIISSPDFRRFTEANVSGYLTLDVRPQEEFANKHKDTWRNIGHLVNAVNIPAAELSGKLNSIENYRNKPVILYAFSGNKEAHEAAAFLISNGFTNVSILAGGIFNIRWTANNVAGNASLAKQVTDIPPGNL